MFLRPLLVLIALLLLPGTVAAGDSIRCGSRIVSVEARAAEVLAACGEPSFRDIYSASAPGRPGDIADTEHWTYNFGSNQLIQVLRLRHGRVVDIRTDGYGFPLGTGRCRPNGIVDGLSKYRLLSTCGEPLTRRDVGLVVALQPRTRFRAGGMSVTRGHVPVEVYREEWVYNFGSRYLLKVVTLEDGVVSDVQNGDRGFDQR